MISADTVYKVINRSSSMVGYAIPEANIRREFQPGESKKIKYSELEKLAYQPGGKELVQDYLLIQDDDLTKELDIHTEPEYYMTEPEIKELLLHGSLDALLDCLDFAPEGVLEILKKVALALPLNDVDKRQAIKEKTGFDITAALRNIAAEHEDEDAPAEDKSAPKRRVQNKTTATRRTANTSTITYKKTE